MLVVKRTDGDVMVLTNKETGERIEIKVCECRRSSVKLGLQAAQVWAIDRGDPDGNQ